MEKTRYKKSAAIIELEQLAFENKKQKFPNFPYPIRPKYRDDTANGLTNCVIDFIKLKGYQAERINSMGNQIKIKGNTKWIKGSSTNGTSDISATIKGRSVKIEIKCKATGDHYQSNEQKSYQKAIEQAGGIYIIVREFKGFRTWLNSFLNGL